MRFFAILPLLLPAVLAREHKQCDCSVKTWNSNMHYDWQLTFNVCKDSFGATAQYDNGAGRCISNPHTRIDGDRWHNDCVSAAKNGYYPVTDGVIDTTKSKLYGTAASTCHD